MIGARSGASAKKALGDRRRPELRIVPIGEKEIEGYVRHAAPYVPRDYEKSDYGDADEQTEADEQSEPDEPKGTVSAALGIPTDRFDFIVGKLLEAPEARLTISLSMPLYKEEIAQAFDDYWMSQDFMVPYDENTPINAYQIHVAHGPGLPRLLGDVYEAEGGDPISDEEAEEAQTYGASTRPQSAAVQPASTSDSITFSGCSPHSSP